MSKAELTVKVCDAIEHLYRAQPGSGSTTERIEHRKLANEIIASLPNKWWRKVPEEICNQFTALS